MLPTFAADPSPLIQTSIYMAGMLTGYALLTGPEDWSQAWDTLRSVWSRHRND